MRNSTSRSAFLLTALAMLALWPSGLAAGAAVSIDAKEVELAGVLRLLAAQGGPTLAPEPSVAQKAITFAIKGAQPQAAMRWLCRACRFVVVPGQGGRLTIGPPSLDKAILKEYAVFSVAPTSAAADGLLSFTKRVVLAAYLNRAKSQDGELVPQLEATLEKGRLKILAPSMVQREVAALLEALVLAKKPGSFEVLRVAYRPYELGMLNPRTPAAIPTMPKGEISLNLAQASAYEAAWGLTSASKASFFIDPWDDALGQMKVTLKAEATPVKAAAAEVCKQLTAETVWFDGAYVLVRASRRGLWEDFSVRVYHVGGMGGPGNFFLDIAERRWRDGKFPPGPFAAERGGESDLPYAVNRVGEEVLAALSGQRQKDLEGFQKGGPPGPPPPFRK